MATARMMRGGPTADVADLRHLSSAARHPLGGCNRRLPQALDCDRNQRREKREQAAQRVVDRSRHLSVERARLELNGFDCCTMDFIGELDLAS